jgi:5-dehydro-2-deoxygluconokinase
MAVPRFILAADHRTQFEDYAREHGVDRERIAAFKGLIVTAMASARSKDSRAREHGGLLLDRIFGAKAIDDAIRTGIPCGEPLEEAGRHPLAWVEDGVEGVAKRRPPFAKVLVRIPAKDPDEYRKHDSAMLEAALKTLGPSAIPLVVELIGEGRRSFNQVTEAIFWIDHGLTVAGPTWWKVAGDADPHQLQRMIDAAPKDSKFLLLGGGEPLQTLEKWFTAAKELSAFVGFAVGRTIFWPAFEAWSGKRIADEPCSDQIRDRYLEVLSRWP